MADIDPGRPEHHGRVTRRQVLTRLGAAGAAFVEGHGDQLAGRCAVGNDRNHRAVAGIKRPNHPVPAD